MKKACVIYAEMKLPISSSYLLVNTVSQYQFLRKSNEQDILDLLHHMVLTIRTKKIIDK